jgi:hypothetical protein
LITKFQIDAMLECPKALIDCHFDTSPDEIT